MNSTDKSKGEHYNLRWNNYFTNLVQVFTELQQKEQMVDVTLVCEGQQLRAHKIVLSACSGFFMDLFQTLEDPQPIVIFHEMKFSHLMHIINFLYQGEVKVLDVDLEGVLLLGEKFQVKGLSSVKLKHKVSPTSDSNLPSQEGTQMVKYEIKSTYKAFPIIQETLPETNRFKKINLDKSTPLMKNKNNATSDSNQPLKKLKSSVRTSPIILNRSMIKERIIDSFNRLKNSHTESKQKTQPIDTSIKIKTEESIDLSDDSMSSHDTSDSREISLKNNEKFSIISDPPKQMDKPANAFLLFSKEWRKKVKLEHPDEDYKNISIRLGTMWKNLTADARESYYMAARQAQLNFQNKYKKTLNINTY